MTAQIAFGIFGVLAGLGAWFDYRDRRIPNWLCLLAAIGGLIWAYTAGGWSAVPWHLAHLVVALIIGMAIYAVKYWGGGDAKFYAGVASWFVISKFFLLVLVISSFGLALVAIAFLLRRRRGSGKAKASLPYGIAIAAGGVVSFILVWRPF